MTQVFQINTHNEWRLNNVNTEEKVRQARAEYQREYYKKNKRRLREYQNKWRKDNPERVKQYNTNYWLKQSEVQDESKQ